jgi:nucleoside-diphosphate-sugar epimerase
MFKSLAGRTAVVTGASKGIGRGIARRLGAVGCSVLVVARNTAETENVVREIMQAGGKASAFRADVADESAMKLMARAAVERYGSLDILCANAGIFPAAKLDVMSGTEFDKVLATNLRGTFLCVSACLPALKRAKGRIVHLLDYRSDYWVSRLVALWREQSRPTRLHPYGRYRVGAGGCDHQCGDAGQYCNRGLGWSWAGLYRKNGVINPDEATGDRGRHR